MREHRIAGQHGCGDQDVINGEREEILCLAIILDDRGKLVTADRPLARQEAEAQVVVGVVREEFPSAGSSVCNAGRTVITKSLCADSSKAGREFAR